MAVRYVRQFQIIARNKAGELRRSLRKYYFFYFFYKVFLFFPFFYKEYPQSQSQPQKTASQNSTTVLREAPVKLAAQLKQLHL
jgi:hypothetical protein